MLRPVSQKVQNLITLRDVVFERAEREVGKTLDLSKVFYYNREVEIPMPGQGSSEEECRHYCGQPACLLGWAIHYGIIPYRAYLTGNYVIFKNYFGMTLEEFNAVFGGNTARGIRSELRRRKKVVENVLQRELEGVV